MAAWMVAWMGRGQRSPALLARSALALASALHAATAPAQTLDLRPLADARLRLEHVEQAGLARDADALTLRIRPGIEAHFGAFTALAEIEGNLAIVDSYYDGLHGATTRPLIGDPESIGLHRAQLQYKQGGTTVTVGRQRLQLDDDRFVDTAVFRQNAQSFDAARIEARLTPKLRADLIYAWNLKTVWGIDGDGARPSDLPSRDLFAELHYASPIGTLTGFAYLVDQRSAAVQGYRLSSQTYGARLAGQQGIGGGRKLAYKLSYARQGDFARNPNDYGASFLLADALVDLKTIRLGAGTEIAGAGTGASRGAALAAFQFPVGSGFRYRGWAGKFNPTPPDGVRDYYATAILARERIGTVRQPSLTATYHRFTSDRLLRDYGDELDLLLSGRIGKNMLGVRYARYKAATFATDTTKLWVQLDWTL